MGNGDKPRAQVFVGIPAYDRTIYVALAEALMRPSKEHDVRVFFYCSSLLTKAFNALWCEALNCRKLGVTHFLMCHNDIEPEPGFVDKMMKLMNEHGADVLSVASPMKAPGGKVSMGIENPENRWAPKLYTIEELHAGPGTFTRPDLVVNTGLMLVDFRKPWVEKVCFHMQNALYRTEAGEFGPVAESEDWYFSRQARGLGAEVFATREVTLRHWGVQAWGNQMVEAPAP